MTTAAKIKDDDFEIDERWLNDELHYWYDFEASEVPGKDVLMKFWWSQSKYWHIGPLFCAICKGGGKPIMQGNDDDGEPMCRGMTSLPFDPLPDDYSLDSPYSMGVEKYGKVVIYSSLEEFQRVYQIAKELHDAKYTENVAKFEKKYGVEY